MKLLIFFNVLSLISVFSYVESYKVLVVFPLPFKSLSILGHGYVRHLLNAGHEVTYITMFPIKNENKNLRQIELNSSDFETLDSNKNKRDQQNTSVWCKHQTYDELDTHLVQRRHNNLLVLNNLANIDNMTHIMETEIQSDDPLLIQNILVESARLIFANENVKRFLQNKNERFDVVIADLIETDIYVGLAALYECPMIWAYSMGAHWHVLRLIDEQTNPAYDPDFISLNVQPFTFTQRVEELWARIKGFYYKRFIIGPKEAALYKECFEPLLSQRGRKLPDYDDVVYNISFIFGNEHNAIRNKPSTPENFKNIGGFHIEVPVKPLPKDLQEIMDKSKNGVIYFSMGSIWKSKMLPPVLIAKLLEVFGELKQTVIWKFEEKLPNLPKNVHIVSWAPQPSILAHPNCLFFISHGGLLSSIESVHFGVAVIGIPVYYDQFININKAVAAGYAIKVELNYDLPKNLKSAIGDMLSDDRYKKKVKELTAIYHDRPVSPGDELVHWVQHVVRTRGALHLRSPALHVPLYQKLYLDLLAVVLVTFVIVITFLKRLCSVICKKNNHDVKKKNK